MGPWDTQLESKIEYIMRYLERQGICAQEFGTNRTQIGVQIGP